MKCPYCGDQESKVVDSRHSDDGLSIRRRRECLSCQKRFTTYETVESLPIIVVKRMAAASPLTGTRCSMAWSGPARSGRCLWPPWSRRFRRLSKFCRTLWSEEVRSETIGELVMGA